MSIFEKLEKYLELILNLFRSRKRPSEEDPEGNMLTGNDPMMGGVEADDQQQQPW